MIFTFLNFVNPVRSFWRFNLIVRNIVIVPKVRKKTMNKIQKINWITFGIFWKNTGQKSELIGVFVRFPPRSSTHPIKPWLDQAYGETVDWQSRASNGLLVQRIWVAYLFKPKHYECEQMHCWWNVSIYYLHFHFKWK